MLQISEVDKISDLIDNVLSRNPEQVKAYKNGKLKVLSFLIGEIMKESKGLVNPSIANKILKEKLQWRLRIKMFNIHKCIKDIKDKEAIFSIVNKILKYFIFTMIQYFDII